MKGRLDHFIRTIEPLYSAECPECQSSLRIQEGFLGELPELIAKRVEKRSGIDSDKVRREWNKALACP